MEIGHNKYEFDYNKFELGDKVKVAGDYGKEFYGDKAFKVINITKISDGYIYKIDSGFNCWLREDWLVAAKNKKHTRRTKI